MRRLFISDLHLSEDHPRLTTGFLALLAAYGPRLDELYILGDWFESWVGDDDDSVWLTPLVEALQGLSHQGKKIHVQHGNRDFLLGPRFVDRFGGMLLPEVWMIDSADGNIRLEHGDALCTDDLKYQAFRQQSRDPAWQADMLAKPIGLRRQMAQMLRLQSKMTQANTPLNITDVNAQAVQAALRDSQAHTLLHGHTHRPGVHHLPDGKTRMVLGDWREDEGTAMIAVQDETGLNLVDWRF